MDTRQANDERLLASSSYSFGYLLRRLRKACDLTQEQLAERAGCATDTIHKIEIDARRPSAALAERFADVLALGGDERAAFIRAARASLAPDQIAVPQRPVLAAGDAMTLRGHVSQVVVRHNLAPQPTPFIGREAELATLGDLLAAPATRLVTICGLGGVGKTRLALAAAEEQLALDASGAARFSHGVCFVSLTGLISTAQLVSAIASALNLSLNLGSRPARHQLIDYLRRKRLLLILDNYEHLLEDVGLITKILESAPGVTIIVTSRERLDLHGEYLYMLEGMAVPAEDVADAAAYAAVRLFLQAARHAQPTFAPGAMDMRSIVAICRLVEGLPLAIELAAAWLALLTPAALLAELRRGIDLLATELRDIPSRQRSIRAVCDAAWQRLSAEERAIFARLAVFQGGFALDAARVVASADLPQLAHLVKHALLRYDHARDRYSIHELPRQYGAEQLAREPAEQTAILLRHATYYCALLARHAADLRGAGQLAAVAVISAEEDNLHAAWRRAVDSRAVDLLELAADGLGGYYEWQGYLHEGAEAFQVAVAAVEPPGDGPEQLRLLARLLAWYGTFAALVGQSTDGEAALQRSLGLLDNERLAARDARAERAFALWRLGQLRARRGDDPAIELYEQSLHLYRELGRDWETSAVLSDLGDLFFNCGRFDEAERALSESQAICERTGDGRGLARALECRSRASFERAQPGEAEHLARQSVDLSQVLGSHASRAAALGRLGIILMHLSRLDEARVYLVRSLELYEDLGDPSMIALAHSRMGLVLLHLGEFESGRRHAQTSVALGREGGGMILAQALSTLALAEEALGNLAAADALFGEGIAYCKAHGLSGYVVSLIGGQAYEAWDLSDRRRARTLALEALRIAVEEHHLLALGMVLPICPLLLLEQGEPVRAAEIYGIDASGPLWHASKLVAMTRERVYASICAALPPEQIAAAQERGRQLDPWTTAAELLEELTAGDEIEC
jgi:predicted ATPase/transcriptional regulator with XRE-family HTH domain